MQYEIQQTYRELQEIRRTEWFSLCDSFRNKCIASAQRSSSQALGDKLKGDFNLIREHFEQWLRHRQQRYLKGIPAHFEAQKQGDIKRNITAVLESTITAISQFGKSFRFISLALDRKNVECERCANFFNEIYKIARIADRQMHTFLAKEGIEIADIPFVPDFVSLAGERQQENMYQLQAILNRYREHLIDQEATKAEMTEVLSDVDENYQQQISPQIEGLRRRMDKCGTIKCEDDCYQNIIEKLAPAAVKQQHNEIINEALVDILTADGPQNIYSQVCRRIDNLGEAHLKEIDECNSRLFYNKFERQAEALTP